MKQFFTALLATCLTTATLAQSNLGVGINTPTPNPSAILDVTSTKQGVLIPRMTRDERNLIQTPATGLMIYQNDNTPGFYFYNGSAWVTLNGATGPAGNPGQGFASGTAGGQVYLTGATSPFAPQAPQTVTGDVTISSTGATSIANNAVTTAKIANGAVNTSKLSATGTPSATTYLRGDGSWATPGSSSPFYSILTSNVTVSTTSPSYANVTSISLEAGKTYFLRGTIFGQRDPSLTTNAPSTYRITYSGTATNPIGAVIYANGSYLAGTVFNSSGGYDTETAGFGVTATTSLGVRFEFFTMISTTTAGTLTVQAARATTNTTNNFILRPGSFILATPVQAGN
ncbi:hypothetical protein [Spirosoma validum]|uniref:Uncharacterized protein n=1 Tax=Spirosoma validum TaxID=2771355 RepID=A0A927GFK4_9BACT|nr:hypothetical protein [Spirosoma validum]MBD2755919.1 hypothetical protein [Spirosoma validum]